MNNNRLDALLIAEAIRLVEVDAPLDDDEANRRAATVDGREQRLLARAALLGERLGLSHALQTWRARAVLAWAGLGLLVFLAGYGLLQGLLGDGRTINVMLAFMTALGLHFLTLGLWLLSLIPAAAGPATLARFSLGNLLLRAAAWPGRRSSGSAYRSLLRPAALGLLDRGRLLPWLLGVASHAIWSAAFVLALAGLWIMFSFRAYELTWETTIQSSDFFIDFIEATGALPRWLGFPVPVQGALATNGPDVQRSLAWWLIGCTFVYGLLPRLLLTLVCAAVVARRRRVLSLDLADPYYRKLLARIDGIGRTVVIDPEVHATSPATPDAMKPPADGAAHALAMVGFELPPECHWPPPQIACAPRLSINVSGSGDQRREALARLQSLQPARTLFVFDQAASPDRGTARFLREAQANGGDASLLLQPVRDGADAGSKRWRAWLADSGLQDLRLFENPAAASAWLEGRHE